MTAVHMPPIHPVMNRIREMRALGEKVFSMAQAVPWYGPPASALEALKKSLDDPGAHLYSPDPGTPAALEAVAADLRLRRGMAVEPGRELHLTCGASQAFLGALLSVADQGDRVLIVEPYYFDHMFAVRFCGLIPDVIPMRETAGWEFPMDQVSGRVRGARALVLVNPGNPTGAVLSRGELEALAEMTEREGCALIIDETYERFNFEGSGWHPWQSGKAEHVLTLGSFSKSFGISGWRLGYLFGPANLMEEALKVQDSVVICPPTPAQILLEHCLKSGEFTDSMASGVRLRLESCRAAMRSAVGLEWRECGGGFFTLAACPGMNGYRAAEVLLEKYRIGTIPGGAFGDAGEGHVRVSFGCLPDGMVSEAMETLASVRLV
jgi:aspartate/methionine/tyrosine aminotransferase